MIRLCTENKPNIIEKIRQGEIDRASLTATSLVEDIIFEMYKQGILNCLSRGLPDKRAKNAYIPMNVIWTMAIAAKMKVQTSLTDIPFSYNDIRVLKAIKANLVSDDENIKECLLSEGTIRFLLNKYKESDFINGYNKTVQDFIFPKMKVEPDIHILDCTKIEVNLNNVNYEGSEVGLNKEGNAARGYKLSTLRGLSHDSGFIEEIRFGSIKTHDLTLSEEMIRKSKVLKPGDILINDRGFISKELVRYLKLEKNIDIYVPLKKNMTAYQTAVMYAKVNNQWESHPKRKGQKIMLVPSLKDVWDGKTEINACVIWEKETEWYSVLITTDLTKTAKEIVMTYELRPEIEEDYRQLKDFWKLEDFKSTKLNVILFHIVSVLFGYLFFQLYTILPNGEQYFGKSFPVLLKGYQPKAQGYIAIYQGGEFGIFTLVEVMNLYAETNEIVRKKLNEVFKLL